MTPGETPQAAGVGKVLDAAFRILSQNFGTYVRIGLAFLAVPVVVTGIYMTSQILFIREQFIYVDDPDSYNVVVVLLGLIIRIAQLLCFGVLVHLSTRLYLGHAETAGSIVLASRQRLGSYLGMSLLLGLYAMGVGILGSLVATPFGPLAPFVLLVVFVVWATYYSLTAPVFWYEGAGASQSISRSAQLVRNRFWQVFTSLLVAFLIVGVFTIGLSALVVSFALRVETALPYVVTTLSLELVGNLIAIIALAPVVTVVYFEGIRMKPELDDERPPPAPW